MSSIIILLTVLCALNVSIAVVDYKFPKQFKFATATSAYQIEGAWESDGKGHSVWDYLTHNYPTRFKNGDTGDIACDSYNNYKTDVQMLKNLGVHMYRFSLSWSRILPHGTISTINLPGIEYYRNLIDELKKNGIEPMVTMFHWDIPKDLYDIGGWLNPDMIDYFVDYARLVLQQFSKDVPFWITFNEPLQTCAVQYGMGRITPGVIAEGTADYICAHNIIRAHAKVYHMYKEEFQSNGKMTLSLDSYWYEPASNSTEDVEAAERAMQFTIGWFGNAIYNRDGNYPPVMIERVGRRSLAEGFQQSRLPQFTNEEVEYIRGTYDYFALNHYTTRYIAPLDRPIDSPSLSKDVGVISSIDESWEVGASDWLYVVPWGLRNTIKWIDTHYNHPDIVITENGYSDGYGDGLDDAKRLNYFREYMSSVLQAIHDDNVSVICYTAWSLMDNFEWFAGYSERFGLYYVNFTDPERTRTIKSSGEFYKNVISTRCVSEGCLQRSSGNIVNYWNLFLSVVVFILTILIQF